MLNFGGNGQRALIDPVAFSFGNYGMRSSTYPFTSS